MTRLIVNRQERLFDHSTVKTWGDLLGELDERSAAEAHVVTAVRLDGVEEPSFREREILAREIGALAVIEVDTAAPAALVDEALEDGCDGLDELCRHAQGVARLFRGTDTAAANRELVDLARGLQALTSLLATLGCVVVGADALATQIDGRPTEAVLGVLARHLDLLVTAQQQADWLTVADIVEHDVIPALRECRLLFDALSSAHAAA